MSKQNAGLVAIIGFLVLALSVLGTLKRQPDRLTTCNGSEMNALLAADLRILIRQHRDALLNDLASPIAGNPQGDVPLVSFLDYNCPLCKEMDLILQQALKHDPNLRSVRKQLPVLGPASEFAARAALASRIQGKYEAFDRALFAFPGLVNQRTTLAVAARVGLDVEQLKRDMQGPAITDAIARDRALANELYITGTPALVVGDEVIAGVVEMAGLQRCIADVRANAKIQSSTAAKSAF
ncbi:DsbA family protein [Mesorhizobium ventifaucium]|uniref:DSBA oxidoreductase n=1 Tax=Mesorhizobium ventifaucium TaxID=666020 RepID=A0ABM9DKK6_9HYPH|nr:DsbA family protein [Mesorhizobium ventifaucium]CAH2396965.1 DSBA oxidoreductase [Mesorhizobium ventifaucium]